VIASALTQKRRLPVTGTVAAEAEWRTMSIAKQPARNGRNLGKGRVPVVSKIPKIPIPMVNSKNICGLLDKIWKRL
jgi:hypothetical protein